MKTILSLFTIGLLMAHAQDLEKERQSQSGTAISIIFDDSGSMNEADKINQAKAAFSKWLEGIPNETKLSLVALNKQLLVPMGSNNKEAVKAKVLALEAGGNTPLSTRISETRQAILDRRRNVTPYERHIVVIFTDGASTDDGGNEAVQARIRALEKDTIESVAIGFHGQGDYMRGVATQYYNAGDTRELLTALKNVASEIDQQSEPVVTPEILALMEHTPAATDSPAPAKKKSWWFW